MEQSNPRISELFQTMDRVRRAWHSVTPCKTLSKSQFGTLLEICHHSQISCEGPSASQPITLSALASAMNQSLPALSQRIRALEKIGYVRRVPDPDDRRAVGISITPKGYEVLLTARKRFNSTLSYAMEQLGSESSSRLISLLAQFADALENAVSSQQNTEESDRI